MSAVEQPSVKANSHFAPRRVLLCALPLLVLLLWIVALSGLATAGGTATADAPARISVQVPDAAKGSRIVMLELSIAVMRKPQAGQLGAVVRLRPAGGSAMEVGRVSMGDSGQSYQFDVSRALGRSSSASAEVEVALIDRGGGAPPTGAALAIGGAQIVAR